MPDRISKISFIELLNHTGNFRLIFRDIVDQFAKAYGDTVLIWDENALRGAFSDWRTGCAEWLLSRQEEMQAVGIDDLDSVRLSHIKSIGLLLECLTQRGHEPILGAQVNGLLPAAARLMAEGFPNEMFSFLGCYQIFCAQQGERGSEANFEPRRPPMHFRFLRSMVAYLRQHDADFGGKPRDASDIYMIFKAMDLFGMNEDYAGPLPAA